MHTWTLWNSWWILWRVPRHLKRNLKQIFVCVADCSCPVAMCSAHRWFFFPFRFLNTVKAMGENIWSNSLKSWQLGPQHPLSLGAAYTKCWQLPQHFPPQKTYCHGLWRGHSWRDCLSQSMALNKQKLCK